MNNIKLKRIDQTTWEIPQTGAMRVPGRIIANETDAVDIYDPNLTLKGINLVYKKQNRKIK